MIIREMRVPDVGAVLDIEKTCFTADAWCEEDFEYRFNDDGFINLVCEDEGKVVGYITTGYVLGELSIDSVAISPEYRRKGIAKKLIEKVIEKTDPDVVLLEVRKSNAPAIALYESLGFEKVGIRREYYQLPVEDAILMTLSIREFK